MDNLDNFCLLCNYTPYQPITCKFCNFTYCHSCFEFAKLQNGTCPNNKCWNKYTKLPSTLKELEKIISLLIDEKLSLINLIKTQETNITENSQLNTNLIEISKEKTSIIESLKLSIQSFDGIDKREKELFKSKEEDNEEDNIEDNDNDNEVDKNEIKKEEDIIVKLLNLKNTKSQYYISSISSVLVENVNGNYLILLGSTDGNISIWDTLKKDKSSFLSYKCHDDRVSSLVTINIGGQCTD